MLKSQFPEKNPALPVEKFPSLIQRRNVMLQHLFIQCSLIICRMVAYGSLKTKENFKLLVLKVVTVAYEWWSLTRGSKYSDLTGELIVF